MIGTESPVFIRDGFYPFLKTFGQGIFVVFQYFFGYLFRKKFLYLFSGPFFRIKGVLRKAVDINIAEMFIFHKNNPRKTVHECCKPVLAFPEFCRCLYTRGDIGM